MFLIVSLAASQSFHSVIYSAFTQSFVLDLEISKLEKNLVVSARVLETTGPASFTGDSWKRGTKTTSPHHDPRKGWLSLCNTACINGASLHLLPVSEFNLPLRSRSERSPTDFFGSELLSDKAQSSDFKNASHHVSSTSYYKRDSVYLIGGCSIPNLSIFTAPFPPSCATALHPADEVGSISAARTLLCRFRSVKHDADISPSIFSIWARPVTFIKGVSLFSIFQNINLKVRTKPRSYLLVLGLIICNSFSMSLDGFTEPLIQTIVHVTLYPSIQKRSLLLWLPVDSPIPSSKTFSMRRVVSPATKQMKLSKSLTVLLSCGAVRTGPEDATDFVPTIFRGVDCLPTSLINVTKFQLSGFAVNFITSTHSSFTQNSLSIYPRGFSTFIFYVILSLCTVSGARVIPSSKCSSNV